MKATTVLLALSLLGCESAPAARTTMASPPPSARFLSQRDATFRLSPEDHALIAQKLNVDALEDVLGWLRPEYREDVLVNLREMVAAPAVAVRIVLVSENDPEWSAAPAPLRSALRRLSEHPVVDGSRVRRSPPPANEP